MVRSDLRDKKISIFVGGNHNTKREFLSKVRAYFEDIHDSVPSINAKGKVLIPGTKALVGYDYLLQLEKMGKSSFVPEGVELEISVLDLLNGVDTKDRKKK